MNSSSRPANWLKISQAAAYFSISRKTLYSLAARNRLPRGAVLRLGRQIRINVATIEAEAGLKEGK